MDDIGTIVEMGFSKSRAQRALTATGNKGSQPAIEWLIQHADDVENEDDDNEADVDESNVTDKESGESSSTSNETATAAQANSYKCNECGKSLRDSLAIEVHANRTGHQDFSESTEAIKPLTDDEKKQKLALLQEKLMAKRAERAENEKLEKIKGEVDRRQMSKAGAATQQSFRDREILKAKEKEIREKKEDARYRAELLRKIEDEKKDRLMRKSTVPSTSIVNTEPVAAVEVKPIQTTSSSSSSNNNYTSARIQVRYPDSSTNVFTFPADTPLEELRNSIHSTWNNAPPSKYSIVLSVPAQRKQISEEEYFKSFKELEFLPSIAIVCNKK